MADPPVTRIKITADTSDFMRNVQMTAAQAAKLLKLGFTGGAGGPSMPGGSVQNTQGGAPGAQPQSGSTVSTQAVVGAWTTQGPKGPVQPWNGPAQVGTFGGVAPSGTQSSSWSAAPPSTVNTWRKPWDDYGGPAQPAPPRSWVGSTNTTAYGPNFSSAARAVVGGYGSMVTTAGSYISQILTDVHQNQADRIAKQEQSRDAGFQGPIESMSAMTKSLPLIGGIISEGLKFASHGMVLTAEQQHNYGSMSTGLAEARMAGTMVSDPDKFFEDSLLTGRGSLSPEESMNMLGSYTRGIGYRPKDDDFDFRRVANSGVGIDAISQFMGLGRPDIGMKPDQSIIEGVIGNSQAQGLTGSTIERLLGIIAGHTQTMAMQGLSPDLGDFTSMLGRMQNTPGMEAMGLRGASGLSNMSNSVMSLRDQQLNLYKPYADAQILADAMSNSNTHTDLIEQLGGIAGSPSRTQKILSRGKGEAGVNATWAYSGAWTRGESQSWMGGLSDTAASNPMHTLDEQSGPDGIPLLMWKYLVSHGQQRRLSNRGSFDTAWMQAETGQGIDAFQMGAGQVPVNALLMAMPGAIKALTLSIQMLNLTIKKFDGRQ